MNRINKDRVFCYVDGYNLYYSIRDFAETIDIKLVWCDLFKLAEQFIDSKTQAITRIYYCSAPYKKNNQDERIIKSRKAQALYCKYHRALYGKKFHSIFGEFKDKSVNQDGGNKSTMKLWEEKRTDVNVALRMLDDAHHNKYDQVLLFSGDSDFIPLIEFIYKYKKKITVILPPTKENRPYRKHHENIITSWNGGNLQNACFKPPENMPDPRAIK